MDITIIIREDGEGHEPFKKRIFEIHHLNESQVYDLLEDLFHECEFATEYEGGTARKIK